MKNPFFNKENLRDNIFNFNKCWKVIREKINAEYNDVSFSKKENLNDKFEFISNGFKYKAYYNEEKDALIISKINCAKITEIKNIFKRTVNN